jgi:hypothetical protein
MTNTSELRCIKGIWYTVANAIKIGWNQMETQAKGFFVALLFSSASCALNFTQDKSEKFWNVCISSRTKSHYFSTCNSFLQCAFRSFLLIWKDMPCVLICGSAMRSPCPPVMPSACPGHPERHGDCGETRPTDVHRLWGGSAWCADIQVCRPLRTGVAHRLCRRPP